MKKKLESRREFLKKVCPTIAFAFFGLSFLEACSTGDDSNNYNPGNDNQNGGSNNNDNDDNDNPLGYSSSGSVFTIDLTHSNFSSLSSIGGWMNGYSIGLSMLFLRISSDHIQAYTNVCPHQGTQNQWSLQTGNIFRCANHNYSFDSTCETSNSLPCFSTNIDGDNLIVAT
tara:strand:+ start:2487 stop:2999 length:513 start_codon:yes stop_codon:yes gene_type:complete